MGKKTGLHVNADFNADALIRKAKNMVSDAYKSNAFAIQCPKCGQTIPAATGEFACPFCGQKLMLNHQQ